MTRKRVGDLLKHLWPRAKSTQPGISLHWFVENSPSLHKGDRDDLCKSLILQALLDLLILQMSPKHAIC